MRSLVCTFAVLVASASLIVARADAQPPVSPADFVAAVSGANAYEVAAAQVALVESRTPSVRAFATAMIRDHDAAEQALTQAALQSRLAPPPSIVGSDQDPLLAELQGLRGVDFDRAYGRQQRLAHRAALATEGGYARMGTDPNLRRAAQGDVAMIERHLRATDGLPR